MAIQIMQWFCLRPLYQIYFEQHYLPGCDTMQSGRSSLCFRGMYCLHLQGRRVSQASSKKQPVRVVLCSFAWLILRPGRRRQYRPLKHWWPDCMASQPRRNILHGHHCQNLTYNTILFWSWDDVPFLALRSFSTGECKRTVGYQSTGSILKKAF
jgi:hypothetical protein